MQRIMPSGKWCEKGSKGAAHKLRDESTGSQDYPPKIPGPLSFNPNADITINTLVDRTFELLPTQCWKGVVFVIDEVGQYVARTARKSKLACGGGTIR